MVRLEGVGVTLGGRRVLRDVTLRLHAGERIGVVGRNGAGKSSLLGLVAGELKPDEGEVRVPGGWRIARVAQEMPATDAPAIEVVKDGDAELRSLEAALVDAEMRGDGRRQAEVHARLEAIDAYTAEPRAATIMQGLGFAADETRAPASALSGGWRMRLQLAAALMCRSDLLLLDEPTNHLDLDAVIWLEDWLQAYAGTLLLISHDREFLDPLVERVAHVDRASVRLYAGNYTAFESRRAAELAEREAERAKQQREIAHVRAFVERFRAKATKARQAQSRLKALGRMERIAPAHVDSPFHFRVPAPAHLPRPLVRLESVSAGYGGDTVLGGVDMTLAPGDRLALLGANGAGKSTLIKVLAGEIAPSGGRREAAPRLELGYFAQHRLEQLRAESSPMAHLARADAHASEQELRDYLGGFGFAGDDTLEPVARLSGGEKARLTLALLLRRAPNLLLLDEPTNHLDLEMRHALSFALQEFAGAVVLVSHDRHLLGTLAEDLWLVSDGGVDRYAGDIDEYARWLRERRRGPAPGASSSPRAPGPSPDKARRRASAEARRRAAPLRARVSALESRLAALHGRKDAITAELADDGLYRDEAKERLKALLVEQGAIERELAAVEEDWLEAVEALEKSEVSPRDR